jgi:hypothetical protein
MLLFNFSLGNDRNLPKLFQRCYYDFSLGNDPNLLKLTERYYYYVFHSEISQTHQTLSNDVTMPIAFVLSCATLICHNYYGYFCKKLWDPPKNTTLWHKKTLPSCSSQNKSTAQKNKQNSIPPQKKLEINFVPCLLLTWQFVCSSFT